jgi:hypothetical protein
MEQAMNEETKGIRRPRVGEAQIDDLDRKLLTLLSENAERSYAELGELVHLSAPAVH